MNFCPDDALSGPPFPCRLGARRIMLASFLFTRHTAQSVPKPSARSITSQPTRLGVSSRQRATLPRNRAERQNHEAWQRFLRQQMRCSGQHQPQHDQLDRHPDQHFTLHFHGWNHDQLSPKVLPSRLDTLSGGQRITKAFTSVPLGLLVSLNLHGQGAIGFTISLSGAN
jgi:hypothetical protein